MGHLLNVFQKAIDCGEVYRIWRIQFEIQFFRCLVQNLIENQQSTTYLCNLKNNVCEMYCIIITFFLIQSVVNSSV